ncbi:hypothetical protein QJQ45_006591 [Haematococcus lacustris]|nr:hypothetical protein QJQ45_006591 [Haematococcus lacustris]
MYGVTYSASAEHVVLVCSAQERQDLELRLEARRASVRERIAAERETLAARDAEDAEGGGRDAGEIRQRPKRRVRGRVSMQVGGFAKEPVSCKHVKTNGQTAAPSSA